MIKLTPTIHFDGCCEQAIDLYKKAFNAKVKCLLRYRDREKGDWDAPITKEEEEKIYHSEIMIGESRIMLGDDIYAVARKTTLQFNTVTFDTAQQVRDAFEVLAQEGTVLHPLNATTYSSQMGTVIDKFGIRWGLMTEQTDE